MPLSPEALEKKRQYSRDWGKRPEVKARRQAEANERYKTDPEFRERRKSQARISVQKRRDKYPEKVKAERRRSGKKIYWQRRHEIFDFYDNKCARCGFEDYRALQIDHINGGGTKHHRERAGTQMLQDVLDNPKDFQILCANCNWIKRHENGEAG